MQLAALVVYALAAQTPASWIEELRWLEGNWRTVTIVQTPDSGGRRLDWSEERWSPLAGGTLLGVARTIRGTATHSFEFMRIASEDGQPSFYGSPGGAPAVRFVMVRSAPNEAVFENLAHDYPQRIAYRREGHRLTATVSLADGRRSQSWTYYLDGEVVPRRLERPPAQPEP